MNAKHETFERLLVAAKKLKRWSDVSSIKKGLALNGLSYSDSRMGNYQSRGLSKDAILDISPIIGCRPQWLLDGSGSMKDYGLLGDFEGDILVIIDGFHLLDNGTKRSWLLTAKDLLESASNHKGKAA